MPRMYESPHRAKRTVYVDGKRFEMPAVKLFVSEALARESGLIPKGKSRKKRPAGATRRGKAAA